MASNVICSAATYDKNQRDDEQAVPMIPAPIMTIWCFSSDADILTFLNLFTVRFIDTTTYQVFNVPGIPIQKVKYTGLKKSESVRWWVVSAGHFSPDFSFHPRLTVSRHIIRSDRHTKRTTQSQSNAE